MIKTTRIDIFRKKCTEMSKKRLIFAGGGVYNERYPKNAINRPH